MNNLDYVYRAKSEPSNIEGDIYMFVLDKEDLENPEAHLVYCECDLFRVTQVTLLTRQIELVYDSKIYFATNYNRSEDRVAIEAELTNLTVPVTE